MRWGMVIARIGDAIVFGGAEDPGSRMSPRGAQPFVPEPDRTIEPAEEGTNVTADVAKRDRLEAERLALLGFQSVGV